MAPKKTDKAEPRKALVKWMGGRDDGLLTVIPQDWIKNFSEKQWNKTAVPLRETQVAEWRVGKKPETGYLCYDCEVLACNGKAETLEAMKKDIIAKEKKGANDGKRQAADRKTEEGASEDADSETAQGADKEEGDRTAAKKTGPKEDEMDLNDSSNEDSDGSSCKSSSKENSRQVKLTASTSTLQKLERKTSILTTGRGNEVEKSPEVSPMPPKRKKSISKLASVAEESAATDSPPSQPDMVPLYKGCPYLVDSIVYNHHKLQGASSFITAILQQLFEPHILVVSNITGAKSKIDPNGMRRWALDRKRLRALKSAVMAHYPKITHAAVNKVIMNHINSLRNRLKTKGKLQKPEQKGLAALQSRAYEEDSSSSENE